MGYYTSHTMEVKTGSHKVSDIANSIYNEIGSIFYGLNEPQQFLLNNEKSNGTFFLGSSEQVKWYDEEDDMIEFSKKFPDAEFIIHGEGEEQGDVWEHWYKNGTMKERHQEYYWTDWCSPE